MNPTRLAPLLHHARQQQEQAARALAQQQQTLARHQQRLAELHRYRDEYRQVPATVASIEQLLGHRAFVARLDSAVQQQTCTLDRYHAQTDSGRQHLLAARRVTRKLEHLAQQYRARQQQADERLAQRQMDDFAARSTFRADPP